MPIKEVPRYIQPLTFTYVFKNKTNGTRRGRLTSHRLKQKEVINFKKIE